MNEVIADPTGQAPDIRHTFEPPFHYPLLCSVLEGWKKTKAYKLVSEEYSESWTKKILFGYEDMVRHWATEYKNKNSRGKLWLFDMDVSAHSSDDSEIDRLQKELRAMRAQTAAPASTPTSHADAKAGDKKTKLEAEASAQNDSARASVSIEVPAEPRQLSARLYPPFRRCPS